MRGCFRTPIHRAGVTGLTLTALFTTALKSGECRVKLYSARLNFFGQRKKGWREGRKILQLSTTSSRVTGLNVASVLMPSDELAQNGLYGPCNGAASSNLGCISTDGHRLESRDGGGNFGEGGLCRLAVVQPVNRVIGPSKPRSCVWQYNESTLFSQLPCIWLCANLLSFSHSDITDLSQSRIGFYPFHSLAQAHLFFSLLPQTTLCLLSPLM